ncbi:recombinase family protein [Formosa sp. L2A11]|uniref:recombinase family protein n=1 Tax=Formosa sp. L2A11 TaxID=2686363 RepID=UPI00131BA218|nr:recombinase family protein [Formosa sp. L2A11]
MEHAVAYLRVSTEEQSLDRQYEEVKVFAESKNLKLVKIFEDKISGSKTKASDRKGFNLMEKHLNKNADIKHILVLEISRLGRKNYDIQTVIEKYIELGVNIHIKDLGQSTLDEKGNRNLASELIISMLGIMAGNESRLLSDRIKSGKMSRARQNKGFNSKIIGYKKGEDETPIIDEEQAPLIRRIFELACQDMGMRSISSVIQSEFGQKFAMGTLGGIIKNTFHKGERKYNDLILEVPAIVSPEIWDKANKLIQSRSKYARRTIVNPNIVQGKISCGECGNILHQKVIPDARLNQFICSNDDCKNSINRPWLFTMVKLAVEEHGKQTRDKHAIENYKNKISSNKDIINLNKLEIKKREKKLSKIRLMYVDDEFTKEEYQELTKDVKDEIKSLTTRINTLNDEITAYKNALTNPIEHFSNDYTVLKDEIKDIVHKVEIYKDRVTINLFGHRIYDLQKPNSSKLGWMSRKIKEGIEIKLELPLRKPISDEQVELMKDDYIRNLK